MGLLDDAIREHLDLKRRRGADPAEVARLEQEALGPVRREPAPAEPAPAEEPRDAPAESAHQAPVEAHDRPEDAPHALAPEERHDPPHGDALFEHHEHDEHEHEHEPEHREDPVLQPTTEYRVEDHHDRDDDEDEPPREPEPHAAAEPEPHAAAHPDDDVLEETPDFLQETPEHDRLWFEQRPPRDFDFDG